MSYRSESEARAAGEETLARMKGDGWELRVWENLGWYYRVYNWPVAVIEISPGEFSASMTDDPEETKVVATPTYFHKSEVFADPNDAVGMLVAQVEIFAERILTAVKRGKEIVDDSKDGRCCHCGTEEPEETPCPDSPDGVHCNHWWDGPEEKSSTGSTGTEGDSDDCEDRPRGDWNEIKAFAAARATMREALEKDEGLRIGYRSNIAMLIDDDLHVGHEKRNELAERLIKLIFGTD